MQRVQFYPNEELAKLLNEEAGKNGVSVSAFVTEVLNDYFGLTKKNTVTISQLTTTVMKEVEAYISNTGGSIEFDLNTASETYRNIDMTCGKKPSTIRASIGRSFGSKIGKAPFANVRKCVVDGVQKTSVNNALMYELTGCENTVPGEDCAMEEDYLYEELELYGYSEEEQSEIFDGYDD